MNRIKKYLYLSIGFISATIGAIGIFVPVLPTVPFLLLALFCFGRSSEKCYNFIINNRYFGDTIKRYKSGKGVSITTKIKAILFLSLGIGFSIYKINSLHTRIFLAIVWIAVTTHILMIKTYKKDVDALSNPTHKKIEEL